MLFVELPIPDPDKMFLLQ